MFDCFWLSVPVQLIAWKFRLVSEMTCYVSSGTLDPTHSPTHLLTYPNVTIRYVRVFAIANPSVVCNVRAPYLGDWNFLQYFLAILYLSHPLTSVQNFTDIAQGNPPIGGVKRKRGSKLERCHVRVSHLLMTFLYFVTFHFRAPSFPLFIASS